MRLTTIPATLIVLTALLGATHATGTIRDDSLLKIDLTPIGGDTLFLKCENHAVRRDLQNWDTEDARKCGGLSLWIDTNDLLRTLQSTHYTAGGRGYDADTPLLP